MPENWLSAAAGNPEASLSKRLEQQQGFSLLELLLAVSLGLLLLGVSAAGLFSEQRLGGRMGLLLRQRQLLLRANQLIAADIERGVAFSP